MAAMVLAWIAGLISMGLTFHKLNVFRRLAYVFAVPIWFAFIYVYVHSYITYVPRDDIPTISLIIRFALAGIAVLGILIPYLDRLEAKVKSSPTVEVKLSDNNQIEFIEKERDDTI